ncbi:hypothetical protein KKF34_17225 [Myxococcota bacterium]|nr:hypothetical protein [Myxococcota bacterium]MBU1382337.1 hypothetical protein [Myxococcota bacterium]MBU1498623.1 hypothetical protein [Myxococcota bacterium]
MKRLLLSLATVLVTLFPAISSAQFHVDPIGGPAGPGPMMQPRRVGFVHEFSLVVSGLTGEGAKDYVAGGGAYYTGLFRAQPNFAIGIHTGFSYAMHAETNDEIQHAIFAGEARFYIPLGPMMEAWAAVNLGGGSLQEVRDTGYDDESRSGLLVGFGLGLNWFISPNLSFGGFFRLYRLMWKDDAYVETADGTFTEAEYYGLWWTVGGSVTLHY